MVILGRAVLSFLPTRTAYVTYTEWMRPSLVRNLIRLGTFLQLFLFTRFSPTCVNWNYQRRVCVLKYYMYNIKLPFLTTFIRTIQ